ncbi:SDR family NAD(P)-dependent oxidoreductase [Glutamicibacter protophormiae]|uniref:NAD(P)-dependent dehydrogenase (Short-subunit alcohol dehydrogenase family) n=1 Tax=Glutamicibacter protophormiae TaxID=37930 RepID=A0ABS4XLR3_GLUPR|nr:SDR family oxidoreductase [Glutamicibacter protophormiae]MBP2397446.1 NAD(P)-dependent dehydrogenase (short-subunit alcohol dehydrogenase family) [Glutamicibacter protophormiae]GGL79186.1 2-hydroxycyclohexane-1-carbonyl-CoA dehydrogenase [Glutamicibacter protophormiae]
MESKPVALVTGSTSGIGVAIAQRLIREGFFVVISGRNTERGETVAAELGERGCFIQADLTRSGAPQRLIDEVVERTGKLDVLINNAAIDHVNWILETPENEIRETFEINTFAAIYCLQAAARTMSEAGGGAIINITSRLASIGVPTMSLYSASKGAILALTKAAAVELAEHNIRVNAVAPGMTRTQMFKDWLASQENPEATERDVSAAIPLGRVALPEDVAGAVAYFADPRNSYVTGTSLPVDGGYLAK